MEELLAKHRKEKKELQSLIQNLKHSVPKGDKKKKREAADEIAKLEKELKEKHESELSGLRPDESLETVCDEREDDVQKKILELSLEAGDDDEADDAAGGTRKKSKAQRKREKKHILEKERRERIEKGEAENVNCSRNIEADKFTKLLQEKGCIIHDIPSDGDCMYKAIEHQLSQIGVVTSVEELRKKAAAFMRENKDDFLPFLTSSSTDDLMTDEEFEDYCNQIEYTKAWGGNLELKALSSSMKIGIRIYQATGPEIVIGEHEGNFITLSYHRHAYQLGEHYNSVVKKLS